MLYFQQYIIIQTLYIIMKNNWTHIVFCKWRRFITLEKSPSKDFDALFHKNRNSSATLLSFRAPPLQAYSTGAVNLNNQTSKIPLCIWSKIHFCIQWLSLSYFKNTHTSSLRTKHPYFTYMHHLSPFVFDGVCYLWSWSVVPALILSWCPAEQEACSKTTDTQPSFCNTALYS